MNILMMTNTYLPHVGGVARSVQTFTAEYRRCGHQVLVVAPTFPGSEELTQESGVARLPAIQQFNGSDFSVRLPLTGLYNETIEDFDAHVIHSHHPFLIGDTALRIAAHKHVPVLFTHHTLYEQYTHYVPFDSEVLKQITIELSTQYANLCDGVIAPSESIATLIQQRGVRTPIQVIPTGIDVAEFASGDGQHFRKDCGIAPDAFVVGHLGRLAPEKNLDYLSRAVAHFLKSQTNAHFLVVGTGPAQEAIAERFVAEGLKNRLILAGTKTGRDLFDAYAAMDVFAFSSFSETQGLVLVEAMAAGVPVVALDAPGVREVLKNEQSGFLLESETSTATFADHLQQLAKSPLLRKKFAAGAKQRAGEFSKERSALKALAFYEAVRSHTQTRLETEEHDAWAALLKRMDIEWHLIADKTKAVVNALLSEDSHNQPRDLSP